MNEFASRNPTTRFSGLEATYDRYRPDYPEALWKFLQEHCQLPDRPMVVDVGCGTGISSRQMAGRGWNLVGIEPNAAMRQVAESRNGDWAGQLIFRDGKAESTGLPDNFADLVVAAQAFHWFRADEALREFQRILKPHGHAALAWNERDVGDPFTARYESAIQGISPEKAIAESSQAATGEALLRHQLFEAAIRVEFSHQQVLDREGIVGRALSISFGPRDAEGRERLSETMRQLFHEFAVDGKVAIRYRTVAFVAHGRCL